MKPNKDFDIEFVGLKLGLHDFEYNIENTFFENIDFIDLKNEDKIFWTFSKILIFRISIGSGPLHNLKSVPRYTAQSTDLGEYILKIVKENLIDQVVETHEPLKLWTISKIRKFSNFF